MSAGARPVAAPGCSQHQYGFAADATYEFVISSPGIPFPPKVPRGVDVTPLSETTKFMNAAARHVGLTVVAGDDGHYQIYNGLAFRNWAMGTGVCNPTAWENHRARVRAALDLEIQIALANVNSFFALNTPQSPF